jgi:hypothetical protein
MGWAPKEYAEDELNINLECQKDETAPHSGFVWDDKRDITLNLLLNSIIYNANTGMYANMLLPITIIVLALKCYAVEPFLLDMSFFKISCYCHSGRPCYHRNCYTKDQKLHIILQLKTDIFL